MHNGRHIYIQGSHMRIYTHVYWLAFFAAAVAKATYLARATIHYTITLCTCVRAHAECVPTRHYETCHQHLLAVPMPGTTFGSGSGPVTFCSSCCCKSLQIPCRTAYTCMQCPHKSQSLPTAHYAAPARHSCLHGRLKRTEMLLPSCTCVTSKSTWEALLGQN